MTSTRIASVFLGILFMIPAMSLASPPPGDQESNARGATSELAAPPQKSVPSSAPDGQAERPNVATSRLHDNVHNLSDVVVGAAVGTIAGRTVTRHGHSNFALVPVAMPGGAGLVFARTSAPRAAVVSMPEPRS